MAPGHYYESGTGCFASGDVRGDFGAWRVVGARHARAGSALRQRDLERTPRVDRMELVGRSIGSSAYDHRSGVDTCVGTVDAATANATAPARRRGRSRRRAPVVEHAPQDWVGQRDEPAKTGVARRRPAADDDPQACRGSETLARLLLSGSGDLRPMLCVCTRQLSFTTLLARSAAGFATWSSSFTLSRREMRAFGPDVAPGALMRP